ncbi:MAG TPA: FGGY-family carbohydrate kinase [Nitriliruptorales bacterium]
MPVTAGIDVGTSSVKALAVDDDGTVLAQAAVTHGFRTPTPGRLEHDAGKWQTGTLAALADLRDQVPRIDAVCVAAMVPSLAAFDEAGEPLTPGLLYGDERGRTDAGSANPASSGEARAFWKWIVEQAPDAAGVWPAQAVANHALLGRPVLDAATAASLYPLFNGVDWDASELTSIGGAVEQAAEVLPLGAAAGEHAGITVASGSVDALGEQAVAGATDPGDVLVVLGSTLLVWAVVDEWRDVERLWSIPHTTPGMFLVGGASNAGGLFRDLVRRVLGLTAHADDPAADDLDPGDVPIWEPYPRGERTPLHDPDRRAVLRGLAMTHGPAGILRAAHEATGFVIRQHLDLAGIRAGRLVVTGGGSRSDAWVQAVCDATGIPADVVAVPEGGALGAAWVARMAAGLETDLGSASRWSAVARRVEPDATWAAACAARHQQFLNNSGI